MCSYVFTENTIYLFITCVYVLVHIHIQMCIDVNMCHYIVYCLQNAAQEYVPSERFSAAVVLAANLTTTAALCLMELSASASSFSFWQSVTSQLLTARLYGNNIGSCDAATGILKMPPLGWRNKGVNMGS